MVLRPEWVVLCPHPVVESHVQFARCGATAGQPSQIGKQSEVVGLCELVVLLCAPASCHGGVVLCHLIAVEGVQHPSSLVHISVFAYLSAHLLGGMIGFVGGKACGVGSETVGESGRAFLVEDAVHCLAQIGGVLFVECDVDGMVGSHDFIQQSLFSALFGEWEVYGCLKGVQTLFKQCQFSIKIEFIQWCCPQPLRAQTKKSVSGAPSAFGFVSGGVAGASFHVFPWFAKEAFFLEVLFEEFDRLVAADDGKVLVNGLLDFQGHLCKRIFFCHYCLVVSLKFVLLRV